MEKKKYKYRSKRDSKGNLSSKKKPKSSFTAKQRMFLLLVWSVIAVGLYIVLSKVSFVYSLWFFAFLLMLCFVLYFITSVQVSRCMEKYGEDSKEFTKLIDRGKILLILMIPIVFIIMYDFVSSTFKMFT